MLTKLLLSGDIPIKYLSGLILTVLLFTPAFALKTSKKVWTLAIAVRETAGIKPINKTMDWVYSTNIPTYGFSMTTIDERHWNGVSK